MKKGPRDTNYPSSRMKLGVFDGSNGQTFHGELLECFQIDDDGWMDTNHFLGCIWMYILYQLDVNYNQYNSSRWDGAMGQCIHLGLYFQLKY